MAHLDFHPCFDGYQCARLSVPLDWSSSKNRGTAEIAIIKKPAAVEVTDERYQGPILFNPGGPGLSGVNFLLHYGSAFEAIFEPKVLVFSNLTLPPAEEKYFDLISFDPRGVNNSTPQPDCISDALTQQVWDKELGAIGTELSDKHVFNSWLARSKLHSQICSADVANVAQFMSTAQVVHDMVEIIERHGEWRSRRAYKLISATKCADEAAIARTAWRPGHEKLQYWGISYGTIVGQMFASMRPERVGRMLLDGVVDAEDYRSVSWTKTLDDIDSITGNFSIECFRAGPTKCELYDRDGPNAISAAIDKLLIKLQREPATSIAADGSPIVVTVSDVTQAIRGNWYNAFYGFPIVSKLLAALLREDYSAFPAQTISSNSEPEKDPNATDKAISCTDGDDISNRTYEDMRSHIAYAHSVSPYFGDASSRSYMECLGYTVRAALRYEAPFGAHTAHPILFAGPTLDPVTPFRNALAASQLFPGSAVLETFPGIGHCTISMPSLTALIAIRRYFVTGELPGTDRVSRFPVSVTPFEALGKPDGVGDEIWAAVRTLATGFPRVSVG